MYYLYVKKKPETQESSVKVSQLNIPRVSNIVDTFSTRHTREQVRRCENSKLSPALSDFDKRVWVKLQKVHDVKDDGWTGGSIRFPYA